VQTSGRKINILYLCTGNSCRSQMAEAYTNVLQAGSCQAYSAGVKAQAQVDPKALQVLREDASVAGMVDVSALRPKTFEDPELIDIQFDYVITVCDNANEHCPIFPARVKQIHQCFDDPPQRVREQCLEGDAALDVYREVRDQIKAFVQTLPERLDVD
jgi:arsenate reductase (thioredoxin)